MLLPSTLFCSSSAVRKIAARATVQFVGANLGILWLMDNLSDEITIETDPRSTDYMKARMGNTRWEFWAGFQPYVRVLTQLVTGERKASSGRIQPINAWNLLERTFRTKANPAWGLMVDIMKGKTFLGEEITAETEDVRRMMINNLMPLVMQDMWDVVQDEGWENVGKGAPGMMGWSVQTYDSASQVVGELRYEYSNYQKKLREFNELHDDRKFEEAVRYHDNNPEITAPWYRPSMDVLKEANGTLNKLEKIIHDIEVSDLTEEEIDALVEEAEYQMIEIASEALVNIDWIKLGIDKD